MDGNISFSVHRYAYTYTLWGTFYGVILSRGLLWWPKQNVCSTGEFKFGTIQIGLQAKSQVMLQEMWADVTRHLIMKGDKTAVPGLYCLQAMLLRSPPRLPHTHRICKEKKRGVGQPDMQSKTRCCFLFSGGGEFWRAIRHRVKILISLYPHCHSSCTTLSLLYKASDAMMKGTVLGVFLFHSFCTLFALWGFLLFWFLVWFKKQNKRKKITWCPSSEWIFKMQRKPILLSWCNSIGFSVIVPV